MDDKVDIRKLVDGYHRNVQELDQAVADLAHKAERLSEAIAVDTEKREATAANLKALRRTQASLEGEKESIRAEFTVAQLENDTNAMQELRKRNRELVSELEDTERNILESSKATSSTNELAEQAARLQVEKDALGKRLPKQYFSTSPNLHPMLEAIAEVLKDDARRLRQTHTAVKIPLVYSRETLEKVKVGTHARKVDPAFAERKRRGREARIEQDKRERISRESVAVSHTGANVTEAGILSGDAIRAALAAKQ